MGLLSEVKRKQKIGPNPNNLSWANDNSSIGQSLLKKMGWKEGGGLGANEDGRVVPVKASMKLNSAGLGCSAKQADVWIAHGEEFDQILASLNASSSTENGDNSSKKSAKDEMEGQRRFYGRFSRGGVKQTRTAEDLNCIFGRRITTSTTTGKDSKEETKSEDSEDSSKEQSESQDENADKSHGVETTTSSHSVQDYFAQKMKKLKEKKSGMEDVVQSLEGATDKQGDEEHEPKTDNLNTYVTSTFSVKDYFSQKMKMRKEKLEAAECKLSDNRESDCEKEDSSSKAPSNVSENSLLNSGEVEESHCDIKTKKEKKKKKKKNETEDMDTTEINSTNDDNENVGVSCTDEKAEEKKKRKKKKSKDVEINDEKSSQTISCCEEKPKKKSKKRKVEDAEMDEEDSTVSEDVTVEETSKKNKKKKKRKAAEELDLCDNDSSIVKSTGASDFEKKKKKIKKKRNKETED